MGRQSSQIPDQESKVEQIAIGMLRFLTMETIFAGDYSIYSTSKVMPSFPVIPCGQQSNKEKYEIAKTFIEDDDVAKLQNKKLFNWTRVTKAVCPLLVPKDGNSLCHACSMILYGIPDYVLLFRRCLSQTLHGQLELDSPLGERWLHHFNITHEGNDMELSEEGIKREWQKTCRASSTRPLDQTDSSQHPVYSGLSQLHVFVLAHVCRRPIIVISDEENDDFPPSIFLPVLLKPEDCLKSFVYLFHHGQDFSPLVYADEFTTKDDIRDLCVPLVTRNFKRFKTPFLLPHENEDETVHQYLFVTKIGYTIKRDFKEVLAARMPDFGLPRENRDLNPNSMIKACFEPLVKGMEPSVVKHLWTWNLGLTTNLGRFVLQEGQSSSSTAKPASLSYQAESDYMPDDEDDDIGSTAHPIPTAIGSGRGPDTSTMSVIPDGRSVDTSMTSSLNTTSSMVRSLEHVQARSESGYSSNSKTNEAASLNPARPASREQSLPSGSAEAEANLHSIGALDDSECVPDSAGMVSSTFGGKIVSTPSESALTGHPSAYTSRPSALASENYHADQESVVASRAMSSALSSRRSEVRYSNGVLVAYEGTTKVTVENVSLIFFTILKLVADTFKFAASKVTAKLERLDSSSDVVRLIIDAPGVEVIYRTIQEDKVKLELIFDKRSGFFRLMVDYYTRISCESTDTRFSTPMLEPSDIGNNYVDTSTHQDKCKTAGCMNRGIPERQNLCESCFQSWQELRDRNQTSGSFFDTTSAEESIDENQPCKTQNCTRRPEAGCRGYCLVCYHRPGS
ncbi:unnamed protein product [Clavelina lepadiformis]|uniref:A20-type domain-containing protein n=1 Tax=Clavelina lepadiformis TaxID=159417 RepID=A0ABP0F0F3_CLALP